MQIVVTVLLLLVDHKLVYFGVEFEFMQIEDLFIEKLVLKKMANVFS